MALYTSREALAKTFLQAGVCLALMLVLCARDDKVTVHLRPSIKVGHALPDSLLFTMVFNASFALYIKIVRGADPTPVRTPTLGGAVHLLLLLRVDVKTNMRQDERSRC